MNTDGWCEDLNIPEELQENAHESGALKSPEGVAQPGGVANLSRQQELRSQAAAGLCGSSFR